MGRSAITIATNEVYGKVTGAERDEGYELMDISSPLPSSSAKLEEMYEVPSSPPPPPPSAVSQPLPSLPPFSALAQSEEEEIVYDVIPGDQ